MNPLIFLKKTDKHQVVAHLSFEMSWLLWNCWWVWREFGLGEFTITSARDGNHRQGSLHYSGDAVDIRTRDFYIPETKGHHFTVLEYRRTIADKFGKYGLGTYLHPDDDIALGRRPGTPHLHLSYIARKGIPWKWSE